MEEVGSGTSTFGRWVALMQPYWLTGRKTPSYLFGWWTGGGEAGVFKREAFCVCEHFAMLF